MSHEEDECDSSSRFAVASQSDVHTYLQAQTKQNRCLSASDDDTNSLDGNLTSTKTSFLSQSCFASISTQKQSLSDDLTELKWLHTFKFKDFLNQDPQSSIDDRISKLIHDLKAYSEKHCQPSFGVLIFLCFHSKNKEKDFSWELNLKDIYDYIHHEFRSITNQHGWKNSIKQTLLTTPCFIKTKHETQKFRSQWTIDLYYRPLLIKAYKIEEKPSTSIVDNFAPKATMKTKVLPRLYERLCGEKLSDDESDSNPISIRSKRTRSASLSKDDKSQKGKQMKLDEKKSTITTRSQTIHRRKSSPPKKRLVSHRPNTRISRKIIEEDLQLLRQAQPLDLSNETST